MKHRGFSYITGVMLTAALTGCTPFQDTGETTAEPHGTIETATPAEASESHTASQTGAPAFHFASGDLVLGDFDYNAIKDNLFNPCTEISAEEFAAVGYVTDGKTLRDEVQGLNGCRIDAIGEPAEHALLITGPDSRTAFQDRGLLVDEAPSEVVPAMYTSRAANSQDNVCYATVDTVRGQFAVAIDDSFRGTPHQELCLRAVQILESFYKINK